MPLTPAQLATLKADIAANTNTIPAGRPFAGTAINALPNTPDANFEIALWYGLTASPAYLAWRTDVSLTALRAAATLANYTPADAPPNSGSTQQITNDQLLYQNRALLCQLKQANAMFALQGIGTLDATSNNARQIFQDCMRNIPSGASGANQDGGWGPPATPGAVRLACQRSARNVEKLFCTAGSGPGNTGADPRGSNTNPDVMGFEGTITGDDVTSARNLP